MKMTYEEMMFFYSHKVTDFQFVIIDERVKQWIGKTFIDFGLASDEDKLKYPVIVD